MEDEINMKCWWLFRVTNGLFLEELVAVWADSLGAAIETINEKMPYFPSKIDHIGDLLGLDDDDLRCVLDSYDLVLY